MKIYKLESNTELIKRFLIHGKGDSPNWFEIKIDYISNKFECQTKVHHEVPKEWIKTSGYTFPSSIFYEFIREAKFIEK